MYRKLGVFLLMFIGYLFWLYFATYESSIDDWWTLNEIKETTEDTVGIGVSLIKVLVGTLIFTFSGFIFYLLIRKRK